jgi:hypothetical protein
MAVDAGQVVTSNSEVRDIRVIDRGREDGYRFEPRNFANIVYQYSVSGQTLTNNRVSIDDDRGDFGIAETIARYPVGMDVTSTTIRGIRATRCWSARPRRAGGGASQREWRSRY